MARFRNISGADVRVGRVDGPLVAAGDVIQVDGEVSQTLADAYVVGEGDTARAWPKSTWELLDEPRQADAPKSAAAQRKGD